MSLETLSLQECVSEMRKYGLKASPRSLAAGIEQGAYKFNDGRPLGAIIHLDGKTKKIKSLIFKSDFESWIEEKTRK